MSIYVSLPTLNEDWIDDNLSELLSMGTDILHSTEPASLAFNMNCAEIEEAFKTIENDDCEYFYGFSPDAEKAEAEAVRYIKYFFEEQGLWGGTVDTAEKIERYNECISEIQFTISELYAAGWISFLGLKYDYETEEK